MEWLRYSIRLVLVIPLQVLLIDQLQWLGIVHPQIYILCLLMLPIRMPQWADMLIGAALGLVMDIYANSLGMHISACVAIMYFRRLLIPRFVSESERISGDICSGSIGTIAMWQMTGILVLIHHLMIGILSAWSFAHFGMTILSILVSSLISFLLIIGYDKIHSA